MLELARFAHPKYATTLSALFAFSGLLGMASCQFDPEPAVKTTPEVDSTVILYPSKDAHVDSENWNLGLGAEMRLAYPSAVAFLAFDSLAKVMPGKNLVKAELIVHGWTDAEWPDGAGGCVCGLDLFKVTGDWQEGTGHWYWHGGGPHNGFENVYRLFPEYQPPATTNPNQRNGITWTNSDSLRKNMAWIAKGKGVLPIGEGSYPLLENTGRIFIDLTDSLAQHKDWSQSFSFALRMSPDSTSSAVGKAWIYSKDHVSPDYAPRLVLTLRSKGKR
jgi:hypothetical protein